MAYFFPSEFAGITFIALTVKELQLSKECKQRVKSCSKYDKPSKMKVKVKQKA